MKQRVYERIAGLTEARTNCIKAGNTDWQGRHEDAIKAIVNVHMPFGSGFDSGTSLDMDKSSSKRLVFLSSFHVMDDNGFYDGWIDFRVIVTPDLSRWFDIRVVGSFGRRNDLRSYVADVFMAALTAETGD